MREYIMQVEVGNSPITVQELVRCKDCKHWVTVVDHKKAEYGLCDAMKAPISATPRDGFCYKGERKETEDAKH